MTWGALHRDVQGSLALSAVQWAAESRRKGGLQALARCRHTSRSRSAAPVSPLLEPLANGHPPSPPGPSSFQHPPLQPDKSARSSRRWYAPAPPRHPRRRHPARRAHRRHAWRLWATAPAAAAQRRRTPHRRPMRPARRAAVGGGRRRRGGGRLPRRYGRCGRRRTPAAADAPPDAGAAGGAANGGQHAKRAQAPRAVADVTTPDADAAPPDADAVGATSWAPVCATDAATTDAGVDADAQRQPDTVPSTT